MTTPGPTDHDSPAQGQADGLLHLRSSGVSLVLDARGGTLPRVVHWGHDLGDIDPNHCLGLRGSYPEQLLLIHLESVGAAASQPSSRKMDYT
jgi:hypothetical protein